MRDQFDYSWFSPGGDPYSGKPLPITLTFEGGGARGILHIGALRAIEQAQHSPDRAPKPPLYDVRGVNGTSIGALVAALCSVGYRSDDLLSDSPPYSKILGLAGYSHAKHMLNKRQRFAIWCLRHTVISVALILPVLLLLIFSLLFLTASALIGWPHTSAIIGVILTAGIIYLAASHCIMGLGSARKLGDFVDLALAAKMNNYNQNQIAERRKKIHSGTYVKIVTFFDIGRANIAAQHSDGTRDRYPRLAVIATNLTTGRLEKFSVARTPEVYVGDAVAASCSLPFLFRPYKIEQTPENQTNAPRVAERKVFRYFDGGITSNLPVWTSDVPRALNPDMVSMSFGTIDDVETDASTPRELVRGLVRSALFGAGVLETRRTRNVPVLLRGENVGLLSFGVDCSTAMSEIDIARRAVADTLSIRSKRRNLFGNAARMLSIEIAKLAASCFQEPVTNDHRGDAIRITVLEPTRFGQNGLKPYLVYCSDPSFVYFEDDSMVYHGENSLPGTVWRSQGQRFAWALSNPGFTVEEQIVGRRVWPSNANCSDERLRMRVWPSKWACAYRLSWSAMPERYGVDDISDPRRAHIVLLQSNVAIETFRSNNPSDVRQKIEEAIRLFDQRLAAELSALVNDDLAEVKAGKQGAENG